MKKDDFYGTSANQPNEKGDNPGTSANQPNEKGDNPGTSANNMPNSIKAYMPKTDETKKDNAIIAYTPGWEKANSAKDTFPDEEWEDEFESAKSTKETKKKVFYNKITTIFLKVKSFFKKFDRITTKIVKFLWKVFIIGMLLNISTYFYPELPDEIPVVYGIYNYMIQLFEFIFWTGINAIEAIFEGKLLEFCNQEFKQRLLDMVKNFSDWLNTI